MSTTQRALLALGMSRLVNLTQKKKQRDRAKKVQAYLKMCKAVNSHVFKTRLRIDSNSLFKLLGLVRPLIEAQNGDLELASVEERLLHTMQYLVTGCSLEQLSSGSNLTPQSLMKVIPETCEAIFNCLRKYMKLPKTEKEWMEIASQFEKKCNFSHCVGALVAKHIPINKPTVNPDRYLNHKGFHSIALVAVVNADHEFIYIEVGFSGADKFIYEGADFFDSLVNSSLELPEDCPLEGGDTAVPYIFVGETHFLIENIMRPYQQDDMSPEKKMFNYRFARAKRVADNALGVLYEKFGVFHQSISLKECDLNFVYLACCALHNYLKKTCDDYMCLDSVDIEDLDSLSFKPASWRVKREDHSSWSETHPLVSLYQEPETVMDSQGERVRELFTNYFNDKGKEPFQNEMVNIVPV